ncbi:MAG: haloacid dehalogenase-like hydrolase [Dehalococcoidia bacterium]|nr:haloacid dehalogenase-like hydrolase [Dehalococcoidia bacterium]
MPVPGEPAPAVVLFDIDGTLLRRSGPHHREALVEAVRRVTGLDTSTDGIPVQGMLDRDILAQMLRAAGASRAQTRAWMPAIVRSAQAIYARRCPPLTHKLCPGVRLLLDRLERAGIPLGLVTGNLSRIAWTKLERAAIRSYFRFGAFAEQGPTRSALARQAVRQARQAGWIGPHTIVSLIGDHPNDVAAARHNRLRAIAVATGLSIREELAACSPDLLLEDLRQLRLEMLL